MQAQPWTTARTPVIAPPRRRDIIVEQMEGEASLFDPLNNHTHHLNETAYAIWQQCDGQRTNIDMAGALTEHYEVNLQTVLEDVDQLVVRFVESGLLRRSTEE